MSEQSVRQAARRSALDAQAVLRKERADRERRLEALAVAALTALGERDALVRDAERRVGQALRTMTEDEGLSVREAVDWCGSGVSARDNPVAAAGGRSLGRSKRTRRMSGRPGRAGRACMIRPQCGSSGEANARAEVTVVDVTAAYWLGPLLTEFGSARRCGDLEITCLEFTGDAWRPSAGRAITAQLGHPRSPPPYLGSLLEDRQHGEPPLGIPEVHGFPQVCAGCAACGLFLAARTWSSWTGGRGRSTRWCPAWCGVAARRRRGTPH